MTDYSRLASLEKVNDDEEPFLKPDTAIPNSNKRFYPETTVAEDEEHLARTWSLNLCLTIGLLLCYIPAVVVLVISVKKAHTALETCASNPQLVPDIAREAKNPVVQQFPIGFRHSPFAGNPSPEVDAAWHSLFEGNDIKVELEELEALGQQSLPLQLGGFIAQPGVFHQLHCLKRIRHWIFRDYYVDPKNPSPAELEEWEAHIHHCIERIRLSIMCNGDTSLSVYKWLKEGDGYVATITDGGGPHQCVVWEDLMEWVGSRSVNMSQIIPYKELNE